MAEVLVTILAEEHAGRLRQPGLATVICFGPARRTVGGDEARLPRAPHRHRNGNDHGHEAAATRDGPAYVEDMRRIGIEEEPPLEQPPRVIDRRSKEVKPRRAEA